VTAETVTDKYAGMSRSKAAAMRRLDQNMDKLKNLDARLARTRKAYENVLQTVNTKRAAYVINIARANAQLKALTFEEDAVAAAMAELEDKQDEAEAEQDEAEQDEVEAEVEAEIEQDEG